MNYLLRFIHVSETAVVAGLAAFTGYVFNLFVRAVGKVAGVRVRRHNCSAQIMLPEYMYIENWM